MTPISPTEIALYVTVGLGLGGVYFFLLQWSVRHQVGGISAGRAISLYLLRIGVAAGVLWMVVQQGALPLLLASAGFLVARFAAVRLFPASGGLE